MTSTLLRAPLLLCSILIAGCGGSELDARVGSSDDPLSAGANGGACAASPYNCKLRTQGGNRVAADNPRDGVAWAVDPGVLVRDGNGGALATSDSTRLSFNFGQVRTFDGQPHGLALSTSNGSAGWFPIAAIHPRASFEHKVGHVSAHDPRQGKLGCYQVRNSHDPRIELKKVVYDSSADHERAGDYLPLVRHNGRRSVNLCFNVPGFGLGGVTIDHFPAGTKFQRLGVPTSSGHPSIDVPLWVKDRDSHYRKRDGTMKFVYGAIVAATGTRRLGWMALDALEPSSGCR